MSTQQMKRLLCEKAYKNIIVDTLQFLVQNNRARLLGLVPIAIGMNNQVRFIWQRLQNYNLTNVQSSFMKSTVKQVIITIIY